MISMSKSIGVCSIYNAKKVGHLYGNKIASLKIEGDAQNLPLGLKYLCHQYKIHRFLDIIMKLCQNDHHQLI